MAETEKKWYVLRAVSGKESKVREYLEAMMKQAAGDPEHWASYISQVLIPTEKTYVMRNGKKVIKEKAYLPGYVLIEANLLGEVIHELRNINYIAGFLPDAANPHPLRQSEVNRILGKMDELEDIQDQMDVQYFVGENIKVISGPFSNFSGTIDEVIPDKKKLKVMVKIFGRGTALELSYMDVEKED
jgi:transcriptional antiterminator NusG